MGGTKRKLRNWGLVLAGLLLALAGPAGAVMLPMSVADLVDEAEHVVAGRVAAMEARWSDDGRFIVTQAVLEVDEAYKGGLGRQAIVMEYRGGEVGDVGMGVSDMPSLEVNEQVIVFLRASAPRAALGAKALGMVAGDDPGATVYRLVGKSQGKFGLAGGVASRSGFSTIGGQAAASMTQEDLVSLIKEEVGRGGR